MQDHAENPMTEVHTGVPFVVFREQSEDEEIEQLLREYLAEEGEALQAENRPDILAEPVQWPTQDLNPVNEYTTEGYMAMTFPPLFPYGHADLRDQSHREFEVNTAEYFNALLRYKDGRFGSHPRYESFEFS